MVTIPTSPNRGRDNDIRASLLGGPVLAPTTAEPRSSGSTAGFVGEGPPLFFRHHGEDGRRGLADLDGDPRHLDPDPDPDPRELPRRGRVIIRSELRDLVSFDNQQWRERGFHHHQQQARPTPSESTSRLVFPNFNGKDVHGWLCSAKQLMDSYNISSDLQVRMAALYLDEAPLSWYRGNVRAKGKPLSWAEFGKGLLSMYDNSKNYKVFDTIPQPLPLLVRKLLDTTPQSLSQVPATNINAITTTIKAAAPLTTAVPLCASYLFPSLPGSAVQVFDEIPAIEAAGGMNETPPTKRSMNCFREDPLLPTSLPIRFGQATSSFLYQENSPPLASSSAIQPGRRLFEDSQVSDGAYYGNLDSRNPTTHCSVSAYKMFDKAPQSHLSVSSTPSPTLVASQPTHTIDASAMQVETAPPAGARNEPLGMKPLLPIPRLVVAGSTTPTVSATESSMPDTCAIFPTRKTSTRPSSNAFAQTIRLNSELANIKTEGSTTAVASDFLHMPPPLLPPLLVSPTSSLLPSHFDSDNALPFILSFVGHQTETEEQFGESSYMALAELIVSKEDERSDARKVFDRMSEKNLISGSTLTSARVLWGPVTPPPKYAPYPSPSMHYSKCLSCRWARKGRYIWVSFPAYLLDHGPEISGVGVLPRGEFPPLSAFQKNPGSGDALLAKLASLGWNAYKVLWTPSLRTSVHFEKWMLIQLTFRVLEARLLGRMMILDVILWKVMICWYTKNGYVRETEELFKEGVAWTASELTEDHSKCQNACVQNMVMRLLRSYMAFETVAGILKGYVGLSAAVYTEIYTGVLHNSSTGLLLFLSLGLLAIGSVTMFFVRPCTPASEEDSSDHGHLFTQIPSALLGLYLLIATIVKDVISVNDAISYALFGIMILLLLAPLAIPVKMSLYPTKPKRTDGIESSSSHEQLSEFDEDRTEPLLAVSLETNLVSLQEIEDDNDVDILLAQGEGAVIPGKKKRRPGRREDFNFKQALVKAEFWLLFLVNFIGVGTGVSVLVPTVSELFGLMHFGKIYNFMALGNPIGALLFSALLAGYVYDQEAARQHTGNSCHGPDCFRLTFFVLSGLSVIGSALGVVLTLRVKPVYQMLYSRVLLGCLKVHCILCPNWAHTSIWCCFH